MSAGQAAAPPLSPAYAQWQATERAGRASYLAAIDQANAMLQAGQYPDIEGYRAAERFAFEAYQSVSRQAWRDYQAAIGNPDAGPAPWQRGSLPIAWPGAKIVPGPVPPPVPTFTPSTGDQP